MTTGAAIVTNGAIIIQEVGGGMEPWINILGSIIGSIIAVIGAIAVMCISNKKAKINNDASLAEAKAIAKMEEEQHNANTRRPFFIIEKVAIDNKFITPSVNGYEYEGKGIKKVQISIKNLGEGVACALTYTPYGFGRIPEESRPKYYIAENETFELSQTIKEKIKSFDITIYYENLLGYKYSQNIKINVNDTYLEDKDDDYFMKLNISYLSSQEQNGMK